MTGRRAHEAALNAIQIQRLLKMKKDGMTNRFCALYFQVGESTIEKYLKKAREGATNDA